MLRAQTSSRIDVGATERERTLAEASVALKSTPRTVTAFPAPNAKDPHDFFAEPEAASPAPTFRAHAETLLAASATISVLTAAFVLTKEEQYALKAGSHLYAWFVDPATRLNPIFDTSFGHSTAATAQAPGLIDLVPLAEIARSLPFLVDTAALAPPDLAAARAWFGSFLNWLTTARVAGVARDTKDHTASAWLLLASSCARLLANDAVLTDCRHRLKAPTLRNQVQATGVFHHEVVTEFPYRNSLLNFDLLAGTCELLSTPFLSLWTLELDDGPGFRGVAAFLYPFLKDPARWPYPADASLFREVPRRRSGLLFAGRAFSRPEYVELWRTLPAPAADNPLLASFPIRQPLLWITRPPHTL